MPEKGWKHIAFDEVELGDQIGGGGVALVYSGWFGRDAVGASESVSRPT